MFTPNKEYNLLDLLRKADAGDLDAMETAVSLLFAEGYTNDDPDGEIAERQIRYLRQLAEGGKKEAYIMLGSAYEKGDGVPKDAAEAVRWYEKAAENGIRFGNECIGMLYYQRAGSPEDYRKAYAYFTKDEGRKAFCTLYALGEMYRRGLYVPKDETKANECYASIVNERFEYKERDDYYWRACFRLAVAEHYGRGTKKDEKSAAALMKKAKELFGARGDHASPADISKEEFCREWLALNQDAGTF